MPPTNTPIPITDPISITTGATICTPLEGGAFRCQPERITVDCHTQIAFPCKDELAWQEQAAHIMLWVLIAIMCIAIAYTAYWWWKQHGQRQLFINK